ncbi:MAG: radical SAM family heme chaperone HemW [Magnetococcales bacterium]|nr:radical SAM family heme chaperone HemW [Magnetococcales bacterium]
MGARLPPLSLYIHVPFCVRKCPYCDFHSTVHQKIPEAAYIEAVKTELTYWRLRLAEDGRSLHSIFFGGGTPSLLQGESIGTILAQVRHLWPLEPECEITLESNPESCTEQKLSQWLDQGVNRVSLGIQAFDERRLKMLDRPHSLGEARQAIHLCRQSPLASLNLDLIFATPGQTLHSWRAELLQACSWRPDHLSCYNLTFEENTPFERQKQAGTMAPLDEDNELELFQATRHTLEKEGFLPYEFSNFSKPGHACRHNLNYWRSGDYLGVGPAAHGRLTQPTTGKDHPTDIQILRTINPRSGYEKGWHNKTPPFSERLCTPEETGIDLLIMGLRLQEGMSRELYQQLTGQDLLTKHRKEIEHCQKAGLLTVDEKRIQLTTKGIPLADAILARLT